MKDKRVMTRASGRRGVLSPSGVVLLEVLLAMAVFSISIVFLINSLAQSFRATVYSRDYTEALFEADNLMAHIWARGMMERQNQEEGALPARPGDFKYRIRASQSADKNVGEWLNEFFVEVSWILGGKKRAFSWRGFIFDAS
ncbi:MAG TPA: hypothetical protein PLB05_07510 [Candidatus Omnitrophota bacterium]|nr:hypothetical protein [Candidatus Omnitrophota bacterium]